jgi:hypothetical protein
MMRIPGAQETVAKEAYELMLRDFDALKTSAFTQTRVASAGKDQAILEQLLQAKLDQVQKEYGPGSTNFKDKLLKINKKVFGTGQVPQAPPMMPNFQRGLRPPAPTFDDDIAEVLQGTRGGKWSDQTHDPRFLPTPPGMSSSSSGKGLPDWYSRVIQGLGKGTSDDGESEKGKGFGKRGHEGGKGDETKGKKGKFDNPVTPAGQAAIDLDRQLEAEWRDHLVATRNRYATPAAYDEGAYLVSIKFGEHVGNLQTPHSTRDAKRILEEWNLCIMRQLLALRDHNSGMDLQRFRKYDGLMISHSGHLLDPGTGAVIWREPGKPQPTCEKVLEGVRATGRTMDARGRPRPGRDTPATDEPRVQLIGRNATQWPPEHIRIPMELFKHQKDAWASECFFCLETGHRGKQCPFLTSVITH